MYGYELLSIVIAFTFLAYVIIDVFHMRKLHELRTKGVLHTKKGTYTFTPKEKKE